MEINAISIDRSGIDRISGKFLADILRREGVDLITTDLPSLPPGTPVYVRSKAELSRVLLRMGRTNCLMLPVLDSESLIGFIRVVDRRSKNRMETQEAASRNDPVGTDTTDGLTLKSFRPHHHAAQKEHTDPRRWPTNLGQGGTDDGYAPK
jgi:hypothetical protein